MEQDYTLRLSLVAHEWAAGHLRAWNAVFAEGRKRGNSAYAGPALVEMEIADADKRAEWAYQTCCEIWEIHGHVKSRAFFRAIFDFCLQPMFSVRESSFRHELELYLKRTGAGIPQGLSAVGGHLKREMGRLLSKWNTKLEIASRDNEYQQQIQAARLQPGRTLTATVPALSASDLRRIGEHANDEAMPPSIGESLSMQKVGAVTSSFTWKELERRFMEIQTKPTVPRSVSAEFTRTEWDAGSVTEEWRLCGDAVCRAEFERVASVAARKLGYAGREDAVDYWLERVRNWLQRTGLDKDRNVTWCPTGSGQENSQTYKTAYMVMERIAELSAMCCVDLMSQGTPESTVSPSLEQPQIADRQPGQGRPKRKANKTKAQLHRASVIYGAIQAGLTGQKYCTALDGRKLRPLEQWKDEGCPETYALAYRNTKWRKRLQDEKCRFREKYDKTPARDREAIIQGELVTRHTRH